MSKYIPILILDEDDTPVKTSMTLSQFMKIILQHTGNLADLPSPDDIYVQISSTQYENDDGEDQSMAEISFYVRKD